MNIALALGALAAAVVAAPAAATIYTLTFDRAEACDGGVCANFDPISQSYGDVPGLDVSYQTVDNPGDSIATGTVNYWDVDFGDLVDVAWGGFDTPSGAAQIILRARQGATIDLLSMEFAGWPATDRTSTVRLYTLDMTFITSFGFTAPGVGHIDVFCGDCSSTEGLVLEWGPDAFNVGIDNVRIDVSGVIPEPATWAMMIAGFGIVGPAARRRRALTA